ncbi:type II secretion system GspH family protein [Candidatus Gracilibacteria bacterium]|nr:type II secretion system GspH family protein [Candidatus Gracilibacteria bacterium]
MQKKKLGFTLIEMLVVIVIIGILSAISTATLKRYFSQARDAARKSTIQNITLMLKIDGAGKWTDDKYMYDVFKLRKLFEKNDYKIPPSQNSYCYLLGMGQGSEIVGDDNEFFITVWGERSGSEGLGTPGPIVDGTQTARVALQSFYEAGDTERLDFMCPTGSITTSSFAVIRSFMNPVLGNNPIYFGIDKDGKLQNSAPGQ